MKRRSVIAGLVVLAAVWGTAARAAETILPDRIVLSRAADPISGITITEADVAGVKYTRFPPRPGAVVMSEPREGIKEISWGDSPNKLRQAISELKEGKYEDAKKSLDALPDAGPREFWYQPCKRQLYAQSQIGMGKFYLALPKLDEIVKQYPRSFYVLDAIQEKMKAHQALKQPEKLAEAAALLDPKAEFANPAAAGPYGKIWQLRGRIAEADALAQSGQPGLARAGDLYKGLADVTEVLLASPPEELKPVAAEVGTIRQRALVGGFQVLVALDPEQAVQWYEKIKNKITDKPARLKMHMASGDLLMKMAEKERDETAKKVKYKQAMLAYMHVYILYPDEKEGRAAAMLEAAKASSRLGTPADSARAARIANEIIAEFPGSPEAREAGKLLEGLGVKVK